MRLSPEDRDRITSIIIDSDDEFRQMAERNAMFKLGIDASVVLLELMVDGAFYRALIAKPAPTEQEIMKGLENEMKLHAVEEILDGLEAAHRIIEDDEDDDDG